MFVHGYRRRDGGKNRTPNPPRPDLTKFPLSKREVLLAMAAACFALHLRGPGPPENRPTWMLSITTYLEPGAGAVELSLIPQSSKGSGLFFRSELGRVLFEPQNATKVSSGFRVPSPCPSIQWKQFGREPRTRQRGKGRKETMADCVASCWRALFPFWVIRGHALPKPKVLHPRNTNCLRVLRPARMTRGETSHQGPGCTDKATIYIALDPAPPGRRVAG